MKKATFIFNFDSREDAEIVAESLKPEIRHKIPKAYVEAGFSGKTFTLCIKAEDISTLRAACNSYLRWVNTVLNVKKIV